MLSLNFRQPDLYPAHMEPYLTMPQPCKRLTA